MGCTVGQAMRCAGACLLLEGACRAQLSWLLPSFICKSTLPYAPDAARMTGWRRAPQCPGGPSKTPAQLAPHVRQRPSAVRFQAVRVYQSRPISCVPQPWQYVLPPVSSWRLPV